MITRSWVISLCVVLQQCHAVHVFTHKNVHVFTHENANKSLAINSSKELDNNFTVRPHRKKMNSGHVIPQKLQGGLVFIKMPKTGGSTFAGVVRRIGFRYGMAHARDGDWRRKGKPDRGAIWAIHGTRQSLNEFILENMPNAFVVSLIRNPISRLLSEYYHYNASRLKKGQAEDLGKIRRLKRCKGSDMVHWAAPDRETPEAVIASYNFIAVTERFDESLLLLGEELGLSLVDLLYLKSKVSGKLGTGQTDLGHQTVYHPPLSDESPMVRRAAEHLEETPDMMTFKLANDELDRARTRYGPEFQDDLNLFQEMLAKAERVCRDKFFESCLWNDNGCGQDCIDDLAKKESWI